MSKKPGTADAQEVEPNMTAGGVEASADAREDSPYQADHEAFMRLAKENEELKDRALRLAADMENLRRRTARDVHDARN